MGVTIGVVRDKAEGETRTPLVPEIVKKYTGLGATIIAESGIGAGLYLEDSAYEDVDFRERGAVLEAADLLLTVGPPTEEDARLLRHDAVLIGLLQPHRQASLVRILQDRKITSFSMELVPRISRAQSMDVLSSQASVAGYRAALLAAQNLDRFFPMLTTAAGTIRPAQVLVIGAGVAGLQAIATARRLGAMIEGYDVRSATREQIESLGAKFVDTGIKAEGEGGYARELTDEEKAEQQRILADHIAAADAVITTAAIPGRQAPMIIPADVVRRMKPGAVIVDLAAESGGNCELTQAGETIVVDGVTIVGPANLSATLGHHASDMLARNLFNFIQPAISEGELAIDWEDEVFAGSVLTHDGEIRHEATRESIPGRQEGDDS
jgi:NAD(P) transhydrogenase subunit alpha